jgi:hypothetical protein
MEGHPSKAVNSESQTRKELTPSPFPLPTGERIEVRGKRKFLHNFINHSPFTKYDSPALVGVMRIAQYDIRYTQYQIRELTY